ncbi:LytR C-terminal domain-containing protein [Polaromonas sp. JS666]|uniref:LytR C-terminal domain-containing protein n=1 Tax=Polaromonas sp. (strain JS666 / ATCC BAA-500) TaxID=296591 RepID=UPI00004647AB|nr:LytR C-terminal domain-containing protein [Polaromonas sp. JS666]ABE44474.1 TPR repeat [Polaromonas sp. JS666]
MFTLRPIVIALGAGLLQACVAPPTQKELAMQPVLRVRHSADQTAATYYQLGKYHQERGNVDLARAAYAYSVELDGRQLEARNALAAIHAQQGRLEDAKVLLLQLVAEYPAVAHPYNNLGFVHYLQGNYDAAVATLQRALVLDSENQRTRNNLQAAKVELAKLGERPAVARAPAPATMDTQGVLPGQATATITENRKDEMTATATAVSTPAPVPAPIPVSVPTVAVQRPAELAVSPAPAPRTQELAVAISPSVPQARMEVVQVVPNVFELRPKPAVAAVAAVAAIAPIIADRQPEKAVVGAATLVPVPALAAARATTSPPSVAATKMSRVEVSNGNGITGMAKRIKGVLGRYGIAVSRLTNDRPFKQQDTKIQYRAGYEQAAESLKLALRGHAVVVPVNKLSGNTDVRLVLGKDAVAHMALIEEWASQSRLASNGEGEISNH